MIQVPPCADFWILGLVSFHTPYLASQASHLTSPGVIDRVVSPQNAYTEAVIPTVMVFRDRGFIEVIKDKCGHKGTALI